MRQARSINMCVARCLLFVMLLGRLHVLRAQLVAQLIATALPTAALAQPSQQRRGAGRSEQHSMAASEAHTHQRLTLRHKSLASPDPLVKRSCLQGAQLFYMGYSEVGRQVSWLMDSLQCSPGPPHKKFGGPATINAWINKCMGPGAHAFFLKRAQQLLSKQMKNGATTVRPNGSSAAANPAAEHTPLRDALCREYFFGLAPINLTCPVANLNISFRWKSFQSDPYDQSSRDQIVEAASTSSTVFVVLEGGGPHHFTKFPDHRFLDSWANPDFASWPQPWIDDWVSSTRQLFHTFSPGKLPPNVCVLHKNMNIAPRMHLAQAAPHHPSTVGGLHHWLNRINTAMSHEFGIHPIDLSEVTLSMRPKGAQGCNSTVNGGRSVAKCEASDGDPFHGYPPGRLARHLIRQMCTLCSSQCGMQPFCELPVGETEGDFAPVRPKR